MRQGSLACSRTESKQDGRRDAKPGHCVSSTSGHPARVERMLSSRGNDMRRRFQNRSAGLILSPLVACLLFAGALACHRAPTPLPSDDATSHHPFDDVRYWRRVFDDPKRNQWQQPAVVIEELQLTAGMNVADLGAGTGYFSRYLASAVGESGTVFAVDTEPNLVEHLRDRAEKEGTPNVVTILAAPDDPRLPQAGIDVVLIVDTYHHIDGRRRYFANLRRALRPGGRVAVIDWHKRELPEGPPVEHKLAREQVVQEMTAAGYRL